MTAILQSALLNAGFVLAASLLLAGCASPPADSPNVALGGCDQPIPTQSTRLPEGWQAHLESRLNAPTCDWGIVYDGKEPLALVLEGDFGSAESCTYGTDVFVQADRLAPSFFSVIGQGDARDTSVAGGSQVLAAQGGGVVGVPLSSTGESQQYVLASFEERAPQGNITMFVRPSQETGPALIFRIWCSEPFTIVGLEAGLNPVLFETSRSKEGSWARFFLPGVGMVTVQPGAQIDYDVVHGKMLFMAESLGEGWGGGGEMMLQGPDRQASWAIQPGFSVREVADGGQYGLSWSQASWAPLGIEVTVGAIGCTQTVVDLHAVPLCNGTS